MSLLNEIACKAKRNTNLKFKQTFSPFEILRPRQSISLLVSNSRVLEICRHYKSLFVKFATTSTSNGTCVRKNVGDLYSVVVTQSN